MRQYIISLDIDHINQDAVYATLPLHCTLMPRFETSMSAGDIRAVLEDAVNRIGFIPMTPGPLERFGLYRDVWAHRIRPEEKIRNLHKEMLSILQEIGANFPESAQWLGDNFTPHVSLVAGRGLTRGRTYVFRSATIFERRIVCEKRLLHPRAQLHL